MLTVSGTRAGSARESGQLAKTDLRVPMVGYELVHQLAHIAAQIISVNGGAIIDHEAPRERRLVAVEK